MPGIAGGRSEQAGVTGLFSFTGLFPGDGLSEVGPFLTCVVEPGRHAERLECPRRRGTDEPAELAWWDTICTLAPGWVPHASPSTLGVG